jgi:hypothetical protein
MLGWEGFLKVSRKIYLDYQIGVQNSKRFKQESADNRGKKYQDESLS